MKESKLEESDVIYEKELNQENAEIICDSPLTSGDEEPGISSIHNKSIEMILSKPANFDIPSQTVQAKDEHQIETEDEKDISIADKVVSSAGKTENTKSSFPKSVSLTQMIAKGTRKLYGDTKPKEQSSRDEAAVIQKESILQHTADRNVDNILKKNDMTTKSNTWSNLFNFKLRKSSTEKLSTMYGARNVAGKPGPVLGVFYEKGTNSDSKNIIICSPLAIQRYQLGGRLIQHVSTPEPLSCFTRAHIGGLGRVLLCGTQKGRVCIIKISTFENILSLTNYHKKSTRSSYQYESNWELDDALTFQRHSQKPNTPVEQDTWDETKESDEKKSKFAICTIAVKSIFDEYAQLVLGGDERGTVYIWEVPQSNLILVYKLNPVLLDQPLPSVDDTIQFFQISSKEDIHSDMQSQNDVTSEASGPLELSNIKFGSLEDKQFSNIHSNILPNRDINSLETPTVIANPIYSYQLEKKINLDNYQESEPSSFCNSTNTPNPHESTTNLVMSVCSNNSGVVSLQDIRHGEDACVLNPSLSSSKSDPKSIDDEVADHSDYTTKDSISSIGQSHNGPCSVTALLLIAQTESVWVGFSNGIITTYNLNFTDQSMATRVSEAAIIFLRSCLNASVVITFSMNDRICFFDAKLQTHLKSIMTITMTCGVPLSYVVVCEYPNSTTDLSSLLYMGCIDGSVCIRKIEWTEEAKGLSCILVKTYIKDHDVNVPVTAISVENSLDSVLIGDASGVVFTLPIKKHQETPGNNMK